MQQGTGVSLYACIDGACNDLLHIATDCNHGGAVPTCDLVSRRQQLQRGGVSQQGMSQLVLWVHSPSDLVLQLRVLGCATIQGLPAGQQGTSLLTLLTNGNEVSGQAQSRALHLGSAWTAPHAHCDVLPAKQAGGRLAV